jgi:hypothetical protein
VVVLNPRYVQGFVWPYHHPPLEALCSVSRALSTRQIDSVQQQSGSEGRYADSSS